MDITKTIQLRPGHYVVAVSGGVDSMALLHILANKYGSKSKDVRFTVAHFDHGIRDQSHFDRQLVHEVASQLGLPFVFEDGNLGPSASEAVAREARYKFLRSVQKHSGAHSIITAHHLDDTIETALLNLIRGTGRKGMSSLHKSKDGLARPLLHVSKSHLRSYAEANGLVWNEDSTNQNQDYKRNYVRHSIIPKAKATSAADYHKLVALLRRQREVNHAIDAYLETILHTQPSKSKLRRRDVAALPYKVASELVAEWLRQNGKRQLSKWLVERLTVAIRTANPKTELLIDGHCKVSFTKTGAEFIKV
ncbi:MAG: tRNA lysidine(34) synthetase TilS [bacterium]|nr:tRNA lysidine(34) synthetase TilS [bacterium]